MRRVSYFRAVVALVVVCVISVSVSARPKEERPIREPREKREPVVKFIKKVIRSLGDGMNIPTP